MKLFLILVGIAAVILCIVYLIAYICYRMAFYSKNDPITEEFPIPDGEIYEPHREQMVSWIKEVRALPQDDITITSFDGLKLHGRFYEYSKDAPIELMFHGYRGNGERDLCGGVQRCFALGHSSLIVDQRACGNSEGHIISFGINESRDLLSWLNYLTTRFPERKIILTGISMGGATVMIASSLPLPKNVVGILSDCGYSSAKEIINIVISQMKLPPKLAYPFVKLGAKAFGNFDLEERSPIESVKHAKVPIIFFHGENDDFVPCSMSRECYEACTAKKMIMTVPDAGHGLSYIIDPEGYLAAVREMEKIWGI